MSGFTTRIAGIGDIPLIVAVQKQTWWVTYEPVIGREQCDYMFETQYSDSSLTTQMEVEGHEFLLLERDGKVCGFASASDQNGNGIFKLHKIYVVPHTQRTGAGKYLLRAMEDRVKKLGAYELRLNVNRDNPAKGFYEKMGYTVIYEEDIPIGDFWMNDYVMGKVLGEERPL